MKAREAKAFRAFFLFALAWNFQKATPFESRMKRRAFTRANEMINCS
jgi:hypothetical protein